MSRPGHGTSIPGIHLPTTKLVMLLVAVLFPLAAYAQTITFTYKLTCDIGPPNCPGSNLSVATQVGQVASDSIAIAAVNSDVPGYTNPVPISGGALNWTSSPATMAQCMGFQCSATYGNPGGSVSLVGSVFGLPNGSTLLTATFQGGATSYSDRHGDTVVQFGGSTTISYVNPVVLANLGMAGLPNNGAGVLDDSFYFDSTRHQNNFSVSVTFTTIGNLQALHDFTGGSDGANPWPPTIDKAGNIYGSTDGGGLGYGTAFKLTRKSSGWVFNPLYSFAAGNDGAYPYGGPIIGSDGSLYGATGQGGGCSIYSPGCGTIYNLRPKPTACTAALCPWIETVLYRFGGPDGMGPGTLLFDGAGSLYGTTVQGGDLGCGVPYGCGTVFKLTLSNGGWTESVLYSFTGGSDGKLPNCCLVFDGAGNLYGTTTAGGANGWGTVFQLKPSGSGGWTETVLYSFDSVNPSGSLVFDKFGNLYGAAGGNGPTGFVFELTPSGGSWSFSVVYNTPSNGLSIDSANNLYGADGGPYGAGNIFELTPSNGSWSYGLLHDFAGGSDGDIPSGQFVFDSAGNIYGATLQGGADGLGVLFELPH